MKVVATIRSEARAMGDTLDLSELAEQSNGEIKEVERKLSTTLIKTQTKAKNQGRKILIRQPVGVQGRRPYNPK